MAPNRPKKNAVVDLQDDKYFPPIDQCPHDSSFNPGFEVYSKGNPAYLTPLKHWCLFGEVTHEVPVGGMSQKVFRITDKAGTSFLVNIQCKDGGLDTTGIRVGSTTLAILYPFRHEQGPGVYNIFVWLPGLVQMLPMSMAELFELDVKIRSQKADAQGKRVCPVCSKAAASPTRCACDCFYFCSKECQDKARDGEHSAHECTQSRLLREIQRLGWARFDKYRQFPL